MRQVKKYRRKGKRGAIALSRNLAAERRYSLYDLTAQSKKLNNRQRRIPMSFGCRIAHYLDLVKFPHTVFSVPFAMISMVVAAGGWPGWKTFFLVLVCLASARTAAMTFNRIADRAIDARNPRTKDRHLPLGLVGVWEAYGLFAGSAVIFLLGAWGLNPLTFKLSPVALLIVCGYSYTKRFTNYSHMVLGLSLALAPIGAWIAVRGVLELPPLVLGLGVLMWVAGFDVIYALPDEGFDRVEGLYSLVVKYGRAGALRLARIMHGICCLALFAFGLLAGLGGIYVAGVVLFAAALWYEHRLVSPDDLSRVNVAFFTVNGTLSLLFAAIALLDKFL